MVGGDGRVPAKIHFTSWRKEPNPVVSALALTHKRRFTETGLGCNGEHFRNRKPARITYDARGIATGSIFRKCLDLKKYRHAGLHSI